MCAADEARAHADVPRALLPLLLAPALDDAEEVSRGAVLAAQAVIALLPPEGAAPAALGVIARVEAAGAGAEDAAVAAARVFAHSAPSWAPAALEERAPELLRRWCSSRSFTVREAMACCMSLVGAALPLPAWRASLLPWFAALCRDNNWRVRRAAALDLPRLAGALHRRQHAGGCGDSQRLAAPGDSSCSCCSSDGDEGTTPVGRSTCSSGGGASSSSARSSSAGSGTQAVLCTARGAPGGSGLGAASAAAGGDECAACSSGGCQGGADCEAAPRCRTSGVAVLAPLGAPNIGSCANASTAPSTGYGARPGDARRQHGAAALATASVWSAHALRGKPAAGGAGAGGVVSMGSHPLSSSLLVDKPAAPAPAPQQPQGTGEQPREAAQRGQHAQDQQQGQAQGQAQGQEQQHCDSPSSSLSSADDPAPVVGSPGDTASPCSPLGARSAEGAGSAQPAPATAAATAAGEQRSPAPQPARAAPPPCAMQQADPLLHACWDALRECVDAVTADSSHWVKVTAQSGLGPCLVALPPCQLSTLLVGRFTAMGSSTTVIYEISVALACAQSLGLVASRLGPQRWPDIRCAPTP